MVATAQKHNCRIAKNGNQREGLWWGSRCVQMQSQVSVYEATHLSLVSLFPLKEACFNLSVFRKLNNPLEITPLHSYPSK